MRRLTRLSPVLAVILAATAGTLMAQTPDTRTADEQIRSALSAAPAAVAEHATVALADGTILRQGTSDWVCLPDSHAVPNNAPMCLDAHWREVIDALMTSAIRCSSGPASATCSRATLR